MFEFGQFRLRKPRPEDAEGFLAISQDDEVMEFYGANHITTLEDAQNQVAWCLEEFDRNGGRWIITEKNREVYIGDVGFTDFVEQHSRAELGYRLCRAYWGRGIMTNFIRQLIPWGFEELGYNRIEALVDTRNAGSRIVLLRNGFQYEGTLRDYEFEHGHFVDLEMYSLLRRDVMP